MRLVLPPPPERYDNLYMAQAMDDIARAVERCWARGEDVILAGSKDRLVLQSPDGSRFHVTVDNAGALTTTAL